MDIMDYQVLADLLFPDVKMTPEEVEAQFPKRDLPEGAKVTRFAPSPTGFIHLGGLYGAMIDERLAHQSGGVFYLRIEDTDAKREVEGAAQALVRTLAEYGLRFDEGPTVAADGAIVERGAYGPYKQSERVAYYHVFAKMLVAHGRAYPVFTTEEELSALAAADKKAEVKNKVWTEEQSAYQREEMLRQREISLNTVRARLAAGDPFVLRILSDGDGEKKIKVTDMVRGELEFPENDEDFVLLKSDGVPTYHFAHAVDDHLMGTTHVVRGEEWLPSLPKHVQLFRYLGFRMPKYLHTAQIMKLDENGNKKKLSKRDLGLDMKDYQRGGYAPACICEYIMTILNSIREIFSTPVNGLSSGAGPVMSFNYGRGDGRRVMKASNMLLLMMVIYTGAIWALLYIFPDPFIRLFTSDEELMIATHHALQIYFFGFVFMSPHMTGQQTFVALGYAKQAVFFSLFRKVIIVVPLTIFLPYLIGVDGVVLAEPISNVIGGIATYTAMRLVVFRTLGKRLANTSTIR